MVGHISVRPDSLTTPIDARLASHHNIPHPAPLLDALRNEFGSLSLPHPFTNASSLRVLVRDFEMELVHFEPGWRRDPLQCRKCARHLHNLIGEVEQGRRTWVPVAPDVFLPVLLPVAGKEVPHWPQVFRCSTDQMHGLLHRWNQSQEEGDAELHRIFAETVGAGGTVLRWSLGEVERFGQKLFRCNSLPVPTCPTPVWYQLFRECAGDMPTMLNASRAKQFARHLFARILLFHNPAFNASHCLTEGVRIEPVTHFESDRGDPNLVTCRWWQPRRSSSAPLGTQDTSSSPVAKKPVYVRQVSTPASSTGSSSHRRQRHKRSQPRGLPHLSLPQLGDVE